MFQYEIQLLKNPQFYIHSSGNIIYKHTFIDTHYQITITRGYYNKRTIT
jgi:hypothetical protein